MIASAPLESLYNMQDFFERRIARFDQIYLGLYSFLSDAKRLCRVQHIFSVSVAGDLEKRDSN